MDDYIYFYVVFVCRTLKHINTIQSVIDVEVREKWCAPK